MTTPTSGAYSSPTGSETYRASAREQRQIQRIQDYILNHTKVLVYGGRTLDRVWNYEAIRRREEVDYKRFLGVGPDDPYPITYQKRTAESLGRALGLDGPADLDEFEQPDVHPDNRTFYCLSKFVQRYRTVTVVSGPRRSRT